MEVGDRFNTKGYEVVAIIDRHNDYGGVILVLHNNSTHYMIGRVDNNDLSTQRVLEDNPLNFVATLVLLLSYERATEEELAEVYSRVLTRAMQLACQRL